ncbi:MAG: hypothetical protein IPK13_12230 [Deltaproteobacteria bacterium]|nr:hypothetical protein [Deltaproteobacteria bacterium]
MTTSTRTEFVTHEAFSLISIRGHIDEHFVIPTMALDNPTLPIIIDTAHVDRLNSFGLRTWLLWISELSKAERPLFFVRCAPPIVTQANYVANFLGSGQVLSFYAPYWCSVCGGSALELIELRAPTPTPTPTPAPTPAPAPDHRPRPATRLCSACALPLELAEVEEEYFGLIERQATASIPEEFWTLLDAILQRLPEAP